MLGHDGLPCGLMESHSMIGSLKVVCSAPLQVKHVLSKVPAN